MMGSKRFWKGFATGTAVGAGAGFGSWLLSRRLFKRQHVRVVRLEKSVQIGKPVDEVFRAWADLERLPSLVRMVEAVQRRGNRSRWRLRLNGRVVEWDAEVTQLVLNQALGWKSVSGPKHTGRINFSPLGNDTEIHVVMNYSPALGFFARGMTENTGVLERYLEQALRNFKAALEGKGQEARMSQPETARIPTGVLGNQEARSTGTFGPAPETSGTQSPPRSGDIPNPIEYTRPPEAKS